MMEHVSRGDAILFMKVGTHANEPLEEIIERKRREITDAGYSLWGYGGNTCHPRTMVQPFAKSHSDGGRIIRLCMQPMASKHFADPVRAEEFSADGPTWKPIPDDINVRGSRYALCLDSLTSVDWDLSLDATEVALGRSKGLRGSAYIKGRVDKACLEVVDGGGHEPAVHIGLVATIVEPYAVFLRN